MSLVSIIIPVYNSEKILKSTIESALAQTYLNKEIIVVDDGSTDNSYELAKQYEAANVKLFRQTNAGAAVARNTGLAHATGEYIQFLDAGDLLSVNKIEQQVKLLDGSQTTVAVCNYVQFFGEGEPSVDLQFPDQSSFIYTSNDPLDFLVNLWGGKGESNFIQTNSWLVPKALIEKAGGWRAYRCPDDDGEFFARVVLAGNGIIYVPGVMNYYRMSLTQTTLSKSKAKKYLQNTLLTIDLKHQYLKKKGRHPLMNKAMAIQYLRFAADNYPAQKILSSIAYKRYQSLNEKVPFPILGGRVIEGVKKIAGWKAARLLRFYTREK